MNIDIKKFEHTWWEDREGNRLKCDKDMVRPIGIDDNDEDVFYHSCFPCKISEEICHYGYHPKGIDKILIKIPFLKNKVKKRIGKTFHHIFTGNVSLCPESQKTAVAMVNSGDYNLSQALWILASSCERCSNVLSRKYLGEEYGYEEYSDEWKKCNTCCDFCSDSEGSDDTPGPDAYKYKSDSKSDS